LAGLEQDVQQCTVFSLDALDFFAHAGTAHQPGNDFVMRSHA